MSTEKMREIFEAAYMRDLVGSSTEDAPLWLERGSDGEYRSFQARGAWWAWQASRAAIEVELPEEYVLPPTMDMQSLANACREQDIAAIQSLGLKVKETSND